MELLDDSETEIFFRVLEKSISEQNDITLPQEVFTPLEMNIHRGPMAFKELIGYFKDPSIAKRQLIITRILPNGDSELAEDTGGVWRDLLTEFWCEFYDRCTMGRSAKVPCLRHDFGEMEWRSAGRILLHGYKFVKYWHVQLAHSFAMHCIDSKEDVLPSDLLQDFHNYVSIPDKEVFQKAVEDFDSVDMEDLLEALDMHNGKCSPTQENIKSILLEMAHKEIIQTPMFVCNCWKQVFNEMDITTSILDEIYSALNLSNKKVVGILSFPDDMDAHSTTVAMHLKRYVKSLDKQKLGLFMRYCTGSDLLTIDKITVEFTVFARPATTSSCSHMCMHATVVQNIRKLHGFPNRI
ncbi:hypothetical protein KP79_PYT12980 [Mizuhopecten yessoensis]|uniref:HECT domain-containing protein n=1 Tax=Mizuhopecten yessoensis TaxID=6573 RepID=A0A210QR56_MIZYE|nr:hypothetical protein KP79_PYT12980 [Mizuhopecten yessoensis]